MNRSLLIVGLVRDCEKHITKEVLRLETHALKIFDNVYFYLVESDSVDGTRESLATLTKSRSNFTFKSFGILSNVYPDRIGRLRYCRNQYVKAIREEAYLQFFDFVLVVDFDIKNRSLNLEPLASYLTRGDWSGLFVNQLGPYYDLLALRRIGWVEGDCFAHYSELAKFMKKKDAKQIAIWGKMKQIPAGSGPIEVRSAFGGMGLYRKDVFLHHDYSPDSEQISSQSEHVELHQKITSTGGRLFIVPSFTNFAYSPHNLLAFRLFRIVDFWTKFDTFRRVRRVFRRALS